MGHFGSVNEGVWIVGSGKIPVAMKTLKVGSSAEDKKKFLQEAVIMAQFRHPNVVVLYGMVSEGEPVSPSHNVLLFFRSRAYSYI